MVQNKKKLPGRPRNFDDNEALDKAICVFWEKGFDATTIDDLTIAMGLNRPSLYNAYGDKEALFMRCLERYGHTSGGLAMAALNGESNTQGAIKSYLRQAAINASGECTPNGCLIASVAPAVENSAVRQFLATSMKSADEAITKRLQSGIDACELSTDFPVIQQARRITDMAMALAMRARVGTSREELLKDAEDGATLALQPFGILNA